MPIYDSRDVRQGDVIIPLVDPLTHQRAIEARDMGGGLKYWARGSGRPNGTKQLPKGTYYLRPRRGTLEFKNLARVENIIAEAINSSRKKWLSWNDAKALLGKKKLSPFEGEGLLRVHLANGTLVASLHRKTHNLGLSEEAREREARRSYSASFANELSSQSEQVGRLLRHGATVGAEREELLRALLERHVPQRYHVAGGFIDGLQQQFDILIYDRIDFAPLFRAGNLVVVPRESIRAIIEVKSNLTSSRLDQSLAHLSCADSVRPHGIPVFRGVFGFQGIGTKGAIERIKHFHRVPKASEPIDELPECVVGIGQMVNAICVLAKTIVITGFSKTGPDWSFPFTPAAAPITSEAGRNVEAAVFFDVLDRHLRHPFDGPFQRGSLLDVISHDIVPGNSVPLYGTDVWGPYFFEGDQGAFEAQLKAYQDWLAGASLS